VFVFEGWVQIGSTSDVSRYMEGYGVSPRLLPLVILPELGGGSPIAAGLLGLLAFGPGRWPLDAVLDRDRAW